MCSWIYLLLVIGAEMIGTTSVKLITVHTPVADMLLMYGMTGLSYFFPALAVKRVPIGVAYALWEGIGITPITAINIAWLDESINLYKVVGLDVVIADILLTKSGTCSASGTPAQPRGEVVTC